MEERKRLQARSIAFAEEKKERGKRKKRRKKRKENAIQLIPHNLWTQIVAQI